MNINTDHLDFKIQDMGTVTINGVYWKQLKNNVDGRGNLAELWSQPWSEEEDVEKEIKHVYWNVTHQGVVKAWHYQFETVSQYACVQGKMQVTLVDVRDGSETLGHVNRFLIGDYNPSFIRISPGILKGWKSIAGDSVIVNLLTSADKSDNFKLPWDMMLSDIWEPKMG